MIDHREALTSVAKLLNGRVQHFGPEEMILQRTAQTASVFLNKQISEYDISIILHCHSLAHLQHSRGLSEIYLGAIQHLSFAAQFCGPETGPNGNGSSEAEKTIDEGIAEMAAKFSPKYPYTVSVKSSENPKAER